MRTVQLPASLDAFATYTAEAIDRMTDRTSLLIQVSPSKRYVQIYRSGYDLSTYTVGPERLERAGDGMTVDQLVWLAQRGWHDSNRKGNLWRMWSPIEEHQAARALVEVLHVVHGAEDAERLRCYTDDYYVGEPFTSGSRAGRVLLLDRRPQQPRPTARPAAPSTVVSGRERTTGGGTDLPGE